MMRKMRGDRTPGVARTLSHLRRQCATATIQRNADTSPPLVSPRIPRRGRATHGRIPARAARAGTLAPARRAARLPNAATVVAGQALVRGPGHPLRSLAAPRARAPGDRASL